MGMLEYAMDVARRMCQLRSDRIVEVLRPVAGKVPLIPLRALEIVHDIATGNDHHAAVPEWGKTCRYRGGNPAAAAH